MRLRSSASHANAPAGKPQEHPRVNSMSAVLDTAHGTIRSAWKYTEDGIRYEIDTPVPVEIVLGGVARTVGKGRYVFVNV